MTDICYVPGDDEINSLYEVLRNNDRIKTNAGNMNVLIFRKEIKLSFDYQEVSLRLLPLIAAHGRPRQIQRGE